MRLLIIAMLAAASLPVLAENQLTDRDRQILAQQQRAYEARIARAKARCIEQRGVDCDTEQGLQEWLLLDRTREEAVLDNVRPYPGMGTVPSSGSGSTTPATTR